MLSLLCASFLTHLISVRFTRMLMEILESLYKRAIVALSRPERDKQRDKAQHNKM